MGVVIKEEHESVLGVGTVEYLEATHVSKLSRAIHKH